MTNHLKYARLIAKLLDRQFSVFGFKFGLDPIFGLIPGLGDIFSVLFSLYLLYVGIQINIPLEARITMLKNILFDLVLGTIPVVGDVADFFFRANSKNMDILNKHAKNASVIEAEIIDENK